MTGAQLFIEVLVFGLALWLGLYLLNRNLADTRLQLAGLGLVVYAGVLALDILAPYAPMPALLSPDVEPLATAAHLPAGVFLGAPPGTNPVR